MRHERNCFGRTCSEQSRVTFSIGSGAFRPGEIREVSPVELTETYLDRIDRLNPRLFAYITVVADEAMAQARRAEEQILRGEYLGSLHGIP